MTPTEPATLEAVLRRRLERTGARLADLRQVEGRFPWIRLGVLLALLVLLFFAFQLLPFAAAWFAVFLALAIFSLVALRHQAVIDRAARLEAFQRLLETRLARLQLDWERIPPPAALAIPPAHPYAADLDIAGDRSLHQLLDTTQSLGGSRRLADWLLEVEPQPERTQARQQLVLELLRHPAFRTRLELNGMLAQASPGRWDGGALLDWLNAHAPAASLRNRLVSLSLLALLNWTLFALNALGFLPPWWIATFLLYFAGQSLRYRETSEVFDEAFSLARQLSQLRGILTDLERYPHGEDSRLAALLEPICRADPRPSAALRRLGRIVSAASLRNNPFLSLLLNILGPWDLFFAYQLERTKRSLQHALPRWLAALYELEALAALANFHDLHPEQTFPEFLPEGSQPVFSAVGLAHPLIPAAVRVANDFTIQTLGEVSIITGSNMSGKSTFLRTVGINLVLARAGGSVTARSLRALPFRLYTSMNLSDSLSDGISFFYAEVRRLRALLDALEAGGPYPLFFLIDEIFRGTNNRERQAGSTAYTKALAGGHGVGLISTHDLELAHLADQIALVRNFHFREDIRDGQMVFDYRLRPDPSPTTNALKIMALAGLPVPGSADGVKST